MYAAAEITQQKCFIDLRDQDPKADPDCQADPDLLVDPARAAGLDATADSVAAGVESPAAWVAVAVAAGAAADLDAPPAAWAAMVADAGGAEAAAGASSNRGAHTKGGLRSIVPNSRRC
jgi:hypothetical protein